MPGIDLRLGIDVGGTNTDAIVLDPDDRLTAKAKVPTTRDVTSGIEAAIAAVVSQPDMSVGRVRRVMLGTTHATNAILERRGLRRVAVLRLGGPATHAVRPLFGWPNDLRETISAGEAIVNGGIEFDGRELSPLDADAVARFLGSVAGRAEGIAITSVFAPVSERHELVAREIVRRELGSVHVSLSHRIGSLGLLERENATVLNAALTGVASQVAGALSDALERHGLGSAERFFVQNDGTLMALHYALSHPVLTIGSGPANSIRGAAYLTGARDAIVIDVGGTSADVGVLVNGFPRESAFGVEIGGVHTNFRMPDLVTIALGGGTMVSWNDGEVQVGPESVGARITQDALLFGGSTPTLTDAAAGAGRISLGDPSRLEDRRRLLTASLRRSDEMLTDVIDRVKVAKGDRPLIAVGGGSILVPETLPGVSEISRPEHFDVANAIGAAIASASGETDRIFHLGPDGRQGAIETASAEARDRAIAAGADAARVEIVDIEEIPLAYLTDPAVRIRVKAAGPLGDP